MWEMVGLYYCLRQIHQLSRINRRGLRFGHEDSRDSRIRKNTGGSKLARISCECGYFSVAENFPITLPIFMR